MSRFLRCRTNLDRLLALRVATYLGSLTYHMYHVPTVSWPFLKCLSDLHRFVHSTRFHSCTVCIVVPGPAPVTPSWSPAVKSVVGCRYPQNESLKSIAHESCHQTREGRGKVRHLRDYAHLYTYVSQISKHLLHANHEGARPKASLVAVKCMLMAIYVFQNVCINKWNLPIYASNQWRIHSLEQRGGLHLKLIVS